MSNELKVIEETNPIEVGTVGVGGMPVSFGNKYQMAKVLCSSGLLPSGLNTPEKVTIALQWGFELGLSPMVAVNNIAVVNGKPTMSIDMLHAIARRSPEYAGCKWVVQDEHRAECIIYRKTANYTEEVRGIYTEDMARDAGLLGKDNWKKYKARMLKHRALGYGLRDAFPDVLAGIYQPEEMEDVPTEKNVIKNITPTETKKAVPAATETAKVELDPTPIENNTTITVSEEKPETLADAAAEIAAPKPKAKNKTPQIKLYTKEQGDELKNLVETTYPDGRPVIAEDEKNTFRKMLVEGNFDAAKEELTAIIKARLFPASAAEIQPDSVDKTEVITTGFDIF